MGVVLFIFLFGLWVVGFFFPRLSVFLVQVSSEFVCL